MIPLRHQLFGGGYFPAVPHNSPGPGNHGGPVKSAHSGIVDITAYRAFFRYKKNRHGRYQLRF